MELTNQQVRNDKIAQFSILYGSMILLLLLILYFTVVYIPHLSRQQQQMNNQEMALFIGDANKIDQQVKLLDGVRQLDGHLLDPIYTTINQLKKTYPDSVYQKVLQSYQLMIGKLDDVKYVDPSLGILQKQQQQAFEKKIALEAAIKSEEAKRKPKPAGTVTPPPPAPSSVGTVAAQEWGPYFPKLLKGNGSFGEANPYIKVNLSIAVEENVVKLIIYFEASFNQYSPTGIDSKISTEEILYTAPKGKTIDTSTLPLKNGWVYAYRDKSSEEDETATSPDGLFTCRIKGNTLWRVGDQKGTQLKVQLNKPLSIVTE